MTVDLFNPDILPPLDADTLRYAAIGAAVGVAINVAPFLWHNRQRIVYNVRDFFGYRADPVVEDPSEYRPFVMSEEERKKLPLATAWSAIWCGAMFAGFMTATMGFAIVIAAVVVIVSITGALIADGAKELSADAFEDGREPPDWKARLGVVASQIGVLCMLCWAYLTMPENEALRNRLGITETHETWMFMLTGVFFFGLAVMDNKKRREEDAVERDGYIATWEADEGVFILIAAGAGLLMMIAVGATILA